MFLKGGRNTPFYYKNSYFLFYLIFNFNKTIGNKARFFFEKISVTAYQLFYIEFKPKGFFGGESLIFILIFAFREMLVLPNNTIN